MSKSKIALILLAFVALVFYACKKEVLTDKQAALQQLVGRWPLKYRIRAVETGGVTKKTLHLITLLILWFLAQMEFISKRTKR